MPHDAAGAAVGVRAAHLPAGLGWGLGLGRLFVQPLPQLRRGRPVLTACGAAGEAALAPVLRPPARPRRGMRRDCGRTVSLIHVHASRIERRSSRAWSRLARASMGLGTSQPAPPPHTTAPPPLSAQDVLEMLESWLSLMQQCPRHFRLSRGVVQALTSYTLPAAGAHPTLPVDCVPRSAGTAWRPQACVRCR